VKSWSVRPASWLASFVGVVKNGLPCRSRASPPAAPRRPPAPRHRDRASPHAAPPRHVPHHPPARLRPQPRSSPQSSAPNPPAAPGQGSASGTSFGGFGVFPLALPPGGHGLNKKLFDDRPLFLLTPQPPRRLWSIRTLRGKVLRQRLGQSHESSAPLSQWANHSQGHCRPVEIARRVRRLQRGLQKLRRRNAHVPALVRSKAIRLPDDLQRSLYL
jgi:hypothetical protein